MKRNIWRLITILNLKEEFKNEIPDIISFNHPKFKELTMYKYVNSGVNWDDERYLMARGLVLDDEGNVVIAPFRKFFNYKELSERENISQKTKELSEWTNDVRYDVFEKLDGSMCCISAYKGELIATSSGSFDSFVTRGALKYLKNTLTPAQMSKFKMACKYNTFIFEYINPEFPHVVNYDSEKLVLIAVNTNQDWQYRTYEHIKRCSEQIGLDYVKKLDLDFEDLLQVNKQRDPNNIKEGVVVLFSNGKRLKFKTEEFFEIHAKLRFVHGKIYSKKKIRKIAYSIIDDTIDDFIAISNINNNKRMQMMIQDSMRMASEFDKMVQDANMFKWETQLTKEEYALNVGSEDIQDQIFLALDKKEKLTRMKERYIIDNMYDLADSIAELSEWGDFQ